MLVSVCSFADDDYFVDAGTVRIVNPTNLSVTGTTTSTFSLNAVKPTGDATDEANPAKVYVPITNSVVPNHDKFFSKYNATSLNILFDTTSALHVIHFPLTVSPSGTKYLYAAVKSPTQVGYKVIQSYGSDITTSEDLTFSFSPRAICFLYANDCSLLLPSSLSYSSPVIFKVYFFLSAISNMAVGDVLDPVANVGGIYFDVGLSNRIYTASELLVSITDVKKGDGRALLSFNSNTSMSNFRKILVFKHTSLPATPNLAIGLYTNGELLDRDFSNSQSGQVVVNQLINNEEAILSIAYEDLYGFASVLSTPQSIVPLDIQEMLNKQSCFLLTAGFGEEHYVIDFFRKYRDQVLFNSFLGRKFVNIYYKEAPYYALAIYKNNSIRWGIRTMAYLFYYIFNYYWIVFLLFLFFYFIKMLKKIMLENSKI